MSKDIFVVVECKDGNARKVSLEQASKAREVARQFSTGAVAVVIGRDVKAAAEDLRSYVDKVIVVDSEALRDCRWDTFTSVLEVILRKYAPYLVFGPATIAGKDLFPRLAARLDAAIVSDAVGISVEGGAVRIRKPLYGGRIVSWLAPRADCPTIVTFRPNSFSIEKASGTGELTEEPVEAVKDPRMEVISIEKGASRKIDLQEADVIVCGGRGMKGPEQFGILEEIAEIMGGRVGASRAVVDSKWREYDDQIGKSGKTVAPKLYIGCGVAGALHHTMGMDTSKVIVAINRDPNALIFQYADYGVVDDLFAVLPPLKEELKRVKEEM